MPDLTWTSEPPTVPGLYLRDTGSVPEAIRIRAMWGAWYYQSSGMNDWCILPHSVRLAGPIPEPKEPSE